MYSVLHHHHHHLPFIVSLSSLRRSSSSSREGRDRVIDFGKYKGKMLGSLPSSYLKWVSKNLRAREYEEWANLADQVLVDPIYRDRIEWEFALNVLNGNVNIRSSSSVSQLQDISDRFGWDNDDKVGWSKVDFDLLGTSKGGRIPRLLNLQEADTQPKQPPPTSTATTATTTSKRMERRERRKIRLRQQSKVDDDDDDDDIQQQQQDNNSNIKNTTIANPFPGRQAFLHKAIHQPYSLNFNSSY